MAKKIGIDFNEKVTEMLEATARRQGITVVKLLRRAIALYKSVHDHAHGRDADLVLIDNDTKEELFRITLNTKGIK